MMHWPAGRILKSIETNEIIAREIEWGEMNVSGLPRLSGPK